MNNREIKFRIWDKIGKIYRGNLYKYLINAHTGELEVWSFSDLYDEWYNTHEGDEHLIVQQYTGLKDKNGAEIYEGDIVQIVEKDETRIYDIVFSHGYFGLNRGPKSKHALMYPYTDVFEIIGNIMQNSELIKSDDE